ncbi:MAG: acetylglutamate kinase [Bacteroidota bacterium]
MKLFVIKIGGNVLDNPAALERFLSDFAAIDGARILIHGGGAIATRIGEKLGLKPQYHNGRRITDTETLDLVTMVYGGLVNKQLVARLQALGVNAIGLTGADGNLFPATKRKPEPVNFGFVGDVRTDAVNVQLLGTLLSGSAVPVLAPLTHEAGTMLNTNADTIAASVAIALSNSYDVRLVYCFEKTGVLEDVSKPDSVIRSMTKARYQQLLTAGALHDGILPKLENAFDAISKGVKEVLIGDAADLRTNTGAVTTGTLITQD